MSKRYRVRVQREVIVEAENALAAARATYGMRTDGNWVDRVEELVPQPPLSFAIDAKDWRRVNEQAEDFGPAVEVGAVVEEVILAREVERT